jgi:hypothetical protein
MSTTAKTPRDYLAGLPSDRRTALEAVRKVIVKHLPRGYEEVIGYGMIAYQVPLSVYPDTYNGQPLLYAALASQKNHMAVYLMCAYGSPKVAQDLKDGFKKAGKRLDMGKSCIRFKKLEDLPLDVIGKAVASCSVKAYVGFTQEAHAGTARKRKEPT